MHLERCTPLIPLLPERSASRIVIPGRDGSVDFNRDSYLPRIIPVDCLLSASSEATIRSYLNDIAIWLTGRGKLIFDLDSAKQWYAKVYSGIEISHYPLARQFNVMFECQPYAEDVTETTDATVDTEQDYGSDIIFYPVITVNITANTATLLVTLLSTGEYILITDSFVNGDEVIINMSTGKVTKNAAGCMDKVNILSTFFGVPPGDQTITVTADSTYTAVMAYRKRYLYA
jgi:predicted phage tail component-like protein